VNELWAVEVALRRCEPWVREVGGVSYWGMLLEVDGDDVSWKPGYPVTGAGAPIHDEELMAVGVPQCEVTATGDETDGSNDRVDPDGPERRF